MTEERKQELKQLLNEAMASLEIRRTGTDPALLPIDVYREHLQQCWTSCAVESLPVLVCFKPNVVSETTKSKLLDCLKEELTPFIYKDKIVSTSYVIADDAADKFNLTVLKRQTLHLNRLLEHLLKITIVRGIERAVSVFDKCNCIEGMYDFFQRVALIEGIRLGAEIQVFEGVQLVPFSDSELLSYLPSPSIFASDLATNAFHGKTLLLIDHPIFCVLHKPFPPTIPFASKIIEEHSIQVNQTFQNGENLHNFKKTDFSVPIFCQALSLACKSPVQNAFDWSFWAEDKFFQPFYQTNVTRYPGPFGNSTEAGETQIKEAERLYHTLVNLDLNVSEKLRIPINRWITSGTNKAVVDRMIDLGIAFEALYLLAGERGEIRFKLAVRAAWHLGKDKDDRNKLLTKFKQIYDRRSKAVHSGKLDKTAKFGEEDIPVLDFIERVQDLCRQSIIKIMEDGRFPNWNDLILGGEVESDIIALNEDPGGLG